MISQESALGVSRETTERLAIYRDLLVRWQKRINLISNSTLEQIEQRHFGDSLQLKKLLHASDKVVDLGSGGGFPGIIVAMLLAETGGGTVDLIESVGKKCAFLREAIRETGLREPSVNIRVHHARIEHALPQITKVSLITARALAPLTKLFELTDGLVVGETRALFQKGERHEEEINEARKIWNFDAELHPSKIDGGSVIIELHNVVRK